MNSDTENIPVFFIYEGIDEWIFRGRNRVIAQTMAAVEEFIDIGTEAHRRIREALMDATEAQMNETQVKAHAIQNRADRADN